MAVKVPHILLLGPSGAGKSTVGQALAERERLHFIELDKFGEDQVTPLGLRPQWNALFYDSAAEALSSEFSSLASIATRHAVVASIPGGAALPRAQIEAARCAGISVVVLYASATDCLSAFLAREATNGRGLRLEVWQDNNAGLHDKYLGPEYSEIRVETFKHGNHRTIDSIIDEVWRVALGR